LADLTAGVELITEQAKRAPAEANAQASTVAGGGREKDPDWTAKMFRVDETNGKLSKRCAVSVPEATSP
jgi:hypothetical protein